MDNLKVIYSNNAQPPTSQIWYYQGWDNAYLFHEWTASGFAAYYYPTRYGSPKWVIHGWKTWEYTWSIFTTEMPIVCSAGSVTFILDYNVAAETGVLTLADFGNDTNNCSPFAATQYSRLWIPKTYEKKETRRYVEYMGSTTDGGFYARYRAAQYWTYELQQAGSILKSLLTTFHPAREIQGSEEAGTIDSIRSAKNGVGGWTITWTRSAFGAWGPISGTNKTFGGLVYGRCPNNGLGE